MSSMITTSAWVRRGVAAQFPTKYEIDEEEMGRISKLARMQLEDAQGDLASAREGKGDEESMDEDNKEGEDDAMDEDKAEKSSKKGCAFLIRCFVNKTDLDF